MIFLIIRRKTLQTLSTCSFAPIVRATKRRGLIIAENVNTE